MNPISIFDTSIRQDAQGRFCLNDLHRAAGGAKKHKPANFLRLDTTMALVDEIGRCSDLSITPVNTVKGNFSTGTTQGTYVCRELVYAYAMWISAKFHLAVIRAFDAMQMQRVRQAVLAHPQPAYMAEAWFVILRYQASVMVHRALARALQIHDSTLSQVLNGSGKYGTGHCSTDRIARRVLRTFCGLRRAAHPRQLSLV